MNATFINYFAWHWLLNVLQMLTWVEISYWYRSSQRGCSEKRGVLRNFAKFTGKHLRQRFFFNKVTGLRPVTLLQKSLWHRFFPVNFAKFLRTTFLQNTAGRLLLLIGYSGFQSEFKIILDVRFLPIIVLISIHTFNVSLGR